MKWYRDGVDQDGAGVWMVVRVDLVPVGTDFEDRRDLTELRMKGARVKGEGARRSGSGQRWLDAARSCRRRGSGAGRRLGEAWC